MNGHTFAWLFLNETLGFSVRLSLDWEMEGEKYLPTVRDLNQGPCQSWGGWEDLILGLLGMCGFLQRAYLQILKKVKNCWCILLSPRKPSGNPRRCCTSSAWPIGGDLPLGWHHWLAPRATLAGKVTTCVMEIVILDQFGCDQIVYFPTLSHKENVGEKEIEGLPERDGGSIFNPGSSASSSFQKLRPPTEAKLSRNSSFQMPVWRSEEPVIEILPICNETLM